MNPRQSSNTCTHPEIQLSNLHCKKITRRARYISFLKSRHFNSKIKQYSLSEVMPPGTKTTLCFSPLLFYGNRSKFAIKICRFSPIFSRNWLDQVIVPITGNWKWQTMRMYLLLPGRLLLRK